MHPLITQQTPFSKSSPFNKPNHQPKTNTSFNTLQQISLHQNSLSQQQLNTSQPIELNKNIKTFKNNKNKSNTSIESSPLINPFILQNSQKQADPQQSSPQRQENFPSSPKFNKDLPKTNNQSTGWGHSLIKFIVERSTNRTIQHQINIIPQNIILHKKCPQDTSNDTLQQTQAALASGKKLNLVYSKIRNQFQNIQTIKKKSQQGLQNDQKRMKSSKLLVSHHQKDKERTNESVESTKSLSTLTKSHSFTGKGSRLKTQPSNKMIIPSGLVSYRFKSMKAQKSVVLNAFNNKSSQQILQTQLKSIKDRLKCASHRGYKIEYRSVGKRQKQTKQKQIAFRQGLVRQQLKDMSASEYLKHVSKEKSRIDKIYGEQGSRLQYISYLMNELSLQRPLAQECVDQIDKMVREQIAGGNAEMNLQEGERRRKYYGSEQNEDNMMLSHRKRMIYKPKRNIKQLHQHKVIERDLTHRSGVVLNSLTFLNQY